MKTGLIHIYYGNGKGKTTASVGLAIRAIGQNLKVLFAQFLKGENSGERAVLAKLNNITLSKVPNRINFCINMTEKEKHTAKIYYTNLINDITKNVENYDLLILDEILGCIECGFIDQDEIINFLKEKPKNLEIVLTGRNAPQKIIDLADYCSNINKIKHPYDKGVIARKGIEF